MKQTNLKFTIFLLSFLSFFTVLPLSVFAEPVFHRFDAWWDKKDNDCKVTLKSSSGSSLATLQVDDGIPITTNQILEVSRKPVKKGWYSPTHYIYSIIYKDENSKVSTGRIIFASRYSSQRFQSALEEIGIN